MHRSTDCELRAANCRLPAAGCGAQALKLAVLRLTAFGDVVHALPLCFVLKRGLPETEILLATTERNAAWTRGLPFLDRVLVLPEGPGAAAALLRAEGLDAILDAQGLYKSALIAFRSGACLRCGFGLGSCREPLAALAYHRHTSPPPRTHIIDKNLSLAALAGVAPVPLEGYSLAPVAADPQGRAAAFLQSLEGRRPALLHPFSSRRDKDFPLEPLQALLPPMRARGWEPVLSSGPGQEALAREAVAVLGCRTAPPFGVRETAFLLARSALLAAPDTGFLHLADALGIPTISRFTHLPSWRNGPRFSPHLVFDRVPPDPQTMAQFVEAL
jgi:heptosyltransferase-1